MESQYSCPCSFTISKVSVENCRRCGDGTVIVYVPASVYFSLYGCVYN